MTLVQTELKSMKIWQPRLPAEYQEVEYIQSSGTQYIDTGIKPTNKTKAVNKGCGTSGIFYGVGVAWSYQSFNLNLDTNQNYRARCRNSGGNSTVDSTVPLGTTSHVFQISQGDGFYIDSTKIGIFTSYTFIETKNLYVFGWNNNGSFTGGANATLYYMQIYEDGTLVRDFVPCYRKSDSVIGLYDLVNDVFYTNAGTGTFTKGSDVTGEKEIKRITIRPLQTEVPYTISNIPTNDTNKYVLVGAANSVKFNFTFTAGSTGAGVYAHISGNNSNSNRYGLSYNKSDNSFIIRGRLGGASDTTYRNVPGFNSSGTNEVELTINKDGNCNITCNGTSTDYTAGTAELNVIQTIMDLSDMNVYGAQTGSYISGNSISIVTTPQTPLQVEKQIRPVQQSLTFSYDFRNKSVATLTNDGWERPDGSSGVSFGANGMYKNSNGYKKAIYPISFAGAKTITLIGTCAAVSDKDIAMGLEYYNGSSWNTATIMWSTGAYDTRLRLWDTSSTLINTFLNTSTISNGEHTVTLTIDTTAKTVSFSDGSNSGTYSLTDSEISVILASQGIRAAVAKSGNYFHDISVTVTY